jgi:hypothetical protein
MAEIGSSSKLKQLTDLWLRHNRRTDISALATITPHRKRKLKDDKFFSAVQSACGFAQAATGPFYCPADQTVVIN